MSWRDNAFFRWLRMEFDEPYRFVFPHMGRPLPKCVVRVCEETDFAACEEIYRLNEPSRFPEGGFGEFREWLRKRERLVLVCKVEGTIRAFGGIVMAREAARDVAHLAYGMVHPEWHGRGYGTVLLLSRLALLPPTYLQLVAMYPVETSASFYRRFGFRLVGTTISETGLPLDLHLIYFYEGDRRRCASRLAWAGIALPKVAVPVTIWPGLLPGDESPSEKMPE